ncbi:MAG: cadmium-translocating P-type ATPase [Anaerolineales bacterium]|nr:cadmium-translocating P-type ATPase [Anaerolineales bacterium]
MAEQTIELEVPLLLPGVEAEDDACLDRLAAALRDRAGLQRAHLERGRQPAALCLHYDPERVSLAEVKRMAERAGAEIVNRYHHTLLPIEGMDCSDCVNVIEHGVGRLEGVLAASVNYAAQTMRVEYDAQKTSRRAIERRVVGLGYRVPAAGLPSWFEANREFVFSLMAGMLLATGWVGVRFLGLPAPAAVSFYLAAYAFGGWDIARHAWHALIERRFDTDLLMVAAALGAAALGEFAEGALLLFLFSLGHALEERALDRARAAVRALGDLAPKTAWLLPPGGLAVEVPVEQLQLQAVVVVRPGVRVPADGEVVAGRSGVDQSPVTGESIPVDKVPGDQVFAGSVNGEGALEVRVTRLARDSTLARVMRMVEEAQTQKSPTQQTIEKFSRVFVPGVLVATGLVIALPPLFGAPFDVSFLRAMTLLVAASPCALALGAPAAILAGVARAARGGVLVKGGVHLENLGRLNAIAFDKTGTITRGEPEVTDVIALGARSESEVLALAAAVENRSGHPLAQAVVRAARARGLALPEIGDVEAVNGRGLKGRCQGQTVHLGSPALMREAGIAFAPEALRQIEELQAAGRTIMLAAIGAELLGVLALADTLRPEAAPAIRALRQNGVRETVMLTGDNARVAAAIARQAGVSGYRAELLPEDKVAAIRALNHQHGVTAMVGDGVNDAPALANATVGIAMGGAATDAALETADVALMGDDLSKLPFAIGLGRATRRIILQNLWLALGVIVVLIAAALSGWAGIGLAISLHEGSTLLVALNALRLLRYAPPA